MHSLDAVARHPTPTWRHLGEQGRQPHPQLPLRVQHVRHGVVVSSSSTTTTGGGQRAAAQYGSRRIQRVLRYDTGYGTVRQLHGTERELLRHVVAAEPGPADIVLVRRLSAGSVGQLCASW